LHDFLGSLESTDDAEVVKKHDAFVREVMLYRLEMEKVRRSLDQSVKKRGK
jgi:hypothetical protein